MILKGFGKPNTFLKAGNTITAHVTVLQQCYMSCYVSKTLVVLNKTFQLPWGAHLKTNLIIDHNLGSLKFMPKITSINLFSGSGTIDIGVAK